jgi:hypothetical protein
MHTRRRCHDEKPYDLRHGVQLPGVALGLGTPPSDASRSDWRPNHSAVYTDTLSTNERAWRFAAGVEAELGELYTTMASIAVDAQCEESFIMFSVMADQHLLRGYLAKRRASQLANLMAYPEVE